MVPREATVVARIVAWLRAQPDVWVFKVHGGAMQTAGIPDLVGVKSGRFFALEVKRPGGKATPLQAAMMRKIAAAGGVVATVTSVEEAREALGC
jgi:hypothetical protein